MNNIFEDIRKFVESEKPYDDCLKEICRKLREICKVNKIDKEDAAYSENVFKLSEQYLNSEGENEKNSLAEAMKEYALKYEKFSDLLCIEEEIGDIVCSDYCLLEIDLCDLYYVYLASAICLLSTDEKIFNNIKTYNNNSGQSEGFSGTFMPPNMTFAGFDGKSLEKASELFKKAYEEKITSDEFQKTIGKENAEKLKSYFYEKTEQFLDFYIKFRAVFREKEISSCKYIIRQIKEYEQLEKECELLRNKLKINSSLLKGTVSDVSETRTFYNVKAEEASNIQMSIHESIMEYIKNGIMMKHTFAYLTTMFKTGDIIFEIFTDEDKEIYDYFFDTDPFKICAGFIILCNENNSIIYRRGIVDAVLYMTFLLLPWVEKKELCHTYFGKKTIPENGLFYRKIRKTDSSGSYYTSKAIDFYKETGVVLYPGKSNDENFYLKELKNMASELKCVTSVNMNNISIIKKSEDKIICLESEKLSLKNKIKSQERQILKYIHEINKRDESTREFTDNTDKGKESKNNNEYNEEYDEKTEGEETIKYSFPFTPERKIVVFGGHDSWLREIRKLISDVRFIRPETKPDIKIIKSADIVWIQTNAIPHMQYGIVLEVTRSNCIPVRYFGFASAVKCARQIVDDERQYNESKYEIVK